MYTLPWVEEIKLRYTSSESSIFVLHGNIRDSISEYDRRWRITLFGYPTFFDAVPTA